jgi:hypothetical protein
MHRTAGPGGSGKSIRGEFAKGSPEQRFGYAAFFGFVPFKFRGRVPLGLKFRRKEVLIAAKNIVEHHCSLLQGRYVMNIEPANNVAMHLTDGKNHRNSAFTVLRFCYSGSPFPEFCRPLA